MSDDTTMRRAEPPEDSNSDDLASLNADQLISRMMARVAPMAPDDPAENAARLAHLHLQNMGIAGRVKRVQHWSEIHGDKPNVHGVDVSDCYIAYVERPTSSQRLASSYIIAVSAGDERVVYAGPAFDEG